MLSDRIENLILEMLERQSSDELLIKRKEIADLLDCAPSQITYVINTRFSGDKRFVVESRRGTGGYIKIALREIGENSLSDDAVITSRKESASSIKIRTQRILQL